MTRLRVGVLGYGYWGPNLVRNLHKIEASEMVAVADRDPHRLSAAKSSYPSIEVMNDADTLLAREDIDAVVVATPPSTHYALAKKALENGKHVLVEKPLTRTTSEAEELVQLARSSRRTLMVDHTFVYCGAVRKIREIIESGELGDIWYVDARRVNLGIFQRDANVIEDLAPHDFSILDYVLNSEPKAVSATFIAPVANADKVPASLAYVTVRLDDDVLAHFHLSWLSPLKIRQTLIGGSKKMLVYDHLEPDHQVKVYDKGLEVVTEGDRRRLLGERRSGDLYAPKVDQTEPLELVCRHFVECALTGQPPLTDGISGLKVVRLLEATSESMRLGGKVIPL